MWSISFAGLYHGLTFELVGESDIICTASQFLRMRFARKV